MLGTFWRSCDPTSAEQFGEGPSSATVIWATEEQVGVRVRARIRVRVRVRPRARVRVRVRVSRLTPALTLGGRRQGVAAPTAEVDRVPEPHLRPHVQGKARTH